MRTALYLSAFASVGLLVTGLVGCGGGSGNSAAKGGVAGAGGGAGSSGAGGTSSAGGTVGGSGSGGASGTGGSTGGSSLAACTGTFKACGGSHRNLGYRVRMYRRQFGFRFQCGDHRRLSELQWHILCI